MRRALRLAERGRGITSPNPPVGAVVVREGRVIAEGWHRGPGQPHAEVEALNAAGERARGATLYVTLAPCTREGRTSACLPRVLEAGVAHVVVATPDPNPAEGEGSIPALRTAGVEVTVGVLEDDARALIGGFAKWITTGIPRVTLKVAMSLDGRAAAADGSSKWVTGPGARRDGHRLRGWSGAVLAGVGTVAADDPELTCRLRGYAGAQPLRVVLDSTARTPLGAAVLRGGTSTLIAASAKATEEAVAALRARGAEVQSFPLRDGKVDLAAVLEELGRRQITDVLVEGGPTVAGDLVERNLLDRYVFYVAPKMLGHLGLSAIAGLVVTNVAEARELTITGVHRVGADIKVEARPRV